MPQKRISTTKIKRLIVLNSVTELNKTEISEIVNIPIGTVRSRLHRARKILQDELFVYAKLNGYLN